MLLNVQSVYSLLQSTLLIDDYVSLAKTLGYECIGIADINVLHASFEFVQSCQRHNIKPMIGMKVKIAGYLDPTRTYSFLLYAKNSKGFQQLIQVSKYINDTNFTIDKLWELLKSFQTIDLVYITDSKHSELNRYIIIDDYERVQSLYSKITNLFGEDIYLGVHSFPYNNYESEKVNQFARKNSIPLVATQHINTLNQEQSNSLLVLKAIKNNEVLSEETLNITLHNYLHSKDEMISGYNQQFLNEVINNTQRLCQQLNVKLPQKKSLLPKYKTPNDQNSNSYLKEIVHKNLNEIIQPEFQEVYLERLSLELDTIFSMGFSDYFLIVADILEYCHKNDIRTGPGRGSAAGSLVSYLLNITKVDPLKHHLLFERFLNPERYNMPDIDIDIPDNKRDKVIKYVQNKYGFNNVAQIVTFGTFGAKQSIRDTLKVLGYSQEIQKNWSTLIPTDQNKTMTLERAYNETPAFKKIVDNNKESQFVFNIAKSIEGIPRHVSTHAAAVIINDDPLETIIPVSNKSQSILQSQYTMYDIEAIGLLKMDFLGLRNLTLLDAMIKSVQHRYDSDFEIENICLNDHETLEIFKKAETNGIFQFESRGIKNVLKQLKPDTFEDIVAVIALYRPGPMKQIPHFIKRKHGLEAVSYVDEILRPILEPTHGIIVYQEQVMQMVRKVAGFSLGQADILRRAMSKKNIELMKEYQEEFIEGALKNNFSQIDAQRLFQYILEFSNYGFNRAHAVVYSVLAYQLAFIKAHYPEVFYIEVLNSGSSQQSTLVNYIEESKQIFGKLLNVDINKSLSGYAIYNQHILIGFNAIKGLRSDLIIEILKDRNLLGPYKDFVNFLQRIPKNYLNTENISPLIQAGAFDNLGYQRATLIENLDSLIQTIQYSGNNLSLFKEMEPKLVEVREFSIQELVNIEKKIYGYNLDIQPIQKFISMNLENSIFSTIDDVLSLKKGSKVRTFGIIKNIKIIETKHHQTMAFILLSNDISEITVVCFPKQYAEFHRIFKENNIYDIKGKVDINRQNEKQIILEHIQFLSESEFESTKVYTQKICYIKVNNYNESKRHLSALKILAPKNSGDYSIIIVDKNNHAFQLNNEYRIDNNKIINKRLKELFGDRQFKFVDKRLD